ncbi:MAG: hypothetical protein ABJ004_05190 [Cyclobacteriaceae bacterium]
MKKHTYILLLLAFTTSCDEDEALNSFGPNTFVYTLATSFDDHIGYPELFTFDIDNGSSKNISVNSTTLYNYQVIHSQIAFVDEYGVYLSNPKNGNLSKLTSLSSTSMNGTAFQLSGIDVSRDLKRVAYSNYDDIFIKIIESSVIQNITLDLEGDFVLPEWSPNGTKVLIRNRVSIKREDYNISTSNFKVYVLSSNELLDVEMFDDTVSPGYAVWHPDENSVIYEQYSAIFQYNLKTQILEQLTPDGVFGTNPSCSPDGQYVSFSKTNDPDQSSDTNINALAILNIKTKEITDVNNLNSHSMNWHDNSQDLIYAVEDNIYLYNTLTGVNEKIVETGESQTIVNVEWLN